MATKRQRAISLVLALVFLGSSIAFSVLVVMEIRNNRQNDNTAQQEDAADSQECQLAEDSGEAKAVPEVFRPEGDVTELQVTDLVAGNGAEAQPGDCLFVKYHGTLATTGALFDGNFDQPSVLKLPIGVGAVIEGWDEGVIGMKEGGVRRLVIPSELAYGEQSSDVIPANSDLVFVVELVKVEKQQ